MASWKSKKGNPFEYDTAYSLMQSGYNVSRSDMNIAGVDLIIKAQSDNRALWYIECKFHKGFSWNELVKYFTKTKKQCKIDNMDITPLLVFKSNNQPVLMMVENDNCYSVIQYNDFFASPWTKRPKGYRIWKDEQLVN